MKKETRKSFFFIEAILYLYFLKKIGLGEAGKKISSRNFRALALETLKESPMLVVPFSPKPIFEIYLINRQPGTISHNKKNVNSVIHMRFLLVFIGFFVIFN